MKKGDSPGRETAAVRRPRAGTRSLALRDGGHVRLSNEPEGEALKVVSAEGEVRLELLLTPSGAVLRIAGPRVVVEAGGELAFRCARFEVQAETIALGSSGEMALSSR